MATKTAKKATKTTKATKTVKKTPTTKKGEPDRLKSGRLSSKGIPCLCGCGDPTATDGARFLTGHDARLKGRMRRIASESEKKGDSPLPKIALPFLREEPGIAGFGMDEAGALFEYETEAAA